MSEVSHKNTFNLSIFASTVFFISTILQKWINFLGSWLPWWILLLLMLLCFALAIWFGREKMPRLLREKLLRRELRFKHHDVIEFKKFPFFLKSYLDWLPKANLGILSFYNIPLATLEDRTARKQLWVDAIGLNPRVKEFRLFLPKEKQDDLVNGLSQIYRDDPANGLSSINALIEKISLVRVKFPPEEVLNFACMLEDDLQSQAIFSSTTIMAPPFWDGKEFSHFFAFLGDKRHTEQVCNIISAHITSLWKASKRKLPSIILFNYPKTASHETPRRLAIKVECVISNRMLLKDVLNNLKVNEKSG